MFKRNFLVLSLLAIYAIGGGNAAFSSDCQPSKWGIEDELGSANYMSPDLVLAATKLVKKGESHGLGIIVEPGVTPAFPPRTTSLQIVQPGQQYDFDLTAKFGWPVVYNDDLSQLWWGTGPQIDGLGHLGEAGVYYNCNRGVDFAQLTGLEKLGLHNVPPLIGRGVMIDMAGYLGVDHMAAGQHFGSSEIKAAAREQGVEIRQADVVLFHTGWTDAKLKAEPTAWVSGEPGLNNEGAVYLASLNPLAVGADTWGVEAVPPAPGDKVFYGHVTLLKENGIYILETMNTGRLAKEGVHEFMFVLGHARVKGTVQMIINPVAMW
ncbi:MAG: cyclase family protein [Pseudomonadota bacterium]|nr:cyclase family protein [Pseudomonadota bacterium]